MVINLFLIQQPPHIASVNLTDIVDAFIKDTAGKHLSEQQKKQAVKRFSTKLNQALITLSEQQHLLLIPSEAVITGSLDVTAVIRQSLAQGEAQ